ncbi:MAG: hypothetical protein PHU14_08475 [Methylovulum sp.]|nr:hypothetical protein [Methylovulum sp.]
MAKLTKEQWQAIRNKWEDDSREGFDWVAAEFNGMVSRQAISKVAKSQGWAKGGALVAQPIKKVAQLKKVAEKVAQPTGEHERTVVKNPVGRPSMYEPEFSEQARKLCLLGQTNEELAIFFEVTTTTIDNWLKTIPAFLGAVKAGREIADANVAASFYERAVGYSCPETKVFNNAGEILTCEVVKHYPPEPGAAKNWLHIRQKEKWPARQILEVDMNLVIVPKEELDEIHLRNLTKQKELMQKALGRAAKLGITNYIDGELGDSE